MNPVRLSLLAIVVLALGVGGYTTLRALGPKPMAPDAGYTVLDGSRSSIGQLRGKVVLVNFWATSCAVCVQEMPQIVATHEKFKNRGFSTLAVSMRYDPPAHVIDFAERRALPFAVAIDNTGAIANAFGNVELTPTSVLIDQHGEIVERIVGAPDFPALHARIEKLLAQR
ncbi:MAG: TlpA disulfide reductase family protein [Burkholderiaceae bacterium]